MITRTSRRLPDNNVIRFWLKTGDWFSESSSTLLRGADATGSPAGSSTCTAGSSLTVSANSVAALFISQLTPASTASLSILSWSADCGPLDSPEDSRLALD